MAIIRPDQSRQGDEPRRRDAVFLDKDGTLVEDIPFNTEPNRIRLLPGTLEGLQALHAAGFVVIIVSNQSGIGRGYFCEDRLQPVEWRLRELLASGGIPLAGFYYCPHFPHGPVSSYARSCDCRKPEPGLLLRAAAKGDICLERSWMVGDILDDVEAGRRAGCQTILMDNGHETVWQLTAERIPHHIAPNLIQAAQIILQGANPSSRPDHMHSGISQ